MAISDAEANRVHNEVKRFFRAYFAELRAQIEERDPDFEVLPDWFKGSRKVETRVCVDGVVVIHWPYAPETRTFPDKLDSYPMFREPQRLVKNLVAELDWSPNPEASPKLPPLMPNYRPLESFEYGYWPEPRRRETYWPSEDRYIEEESPWTRLDYTHESNLGAWRDESLAREQARFVVGFHLG